LIVACSNIFKNISPQRTRRNTEVWIAGSWFLSVIYVQNIFSRRKIQVLRIALYIKTSVFLCDPCGEQVLIQLNPIPPGNRVLTFD